MEKELVENKYDFKVISNELKQDIYVRPLIQQYCLSHYLSKFLQETRWYVCMYVYLYYSLED
jgi:hypothetical protein